MANIKKILFLDIETAPLTASYAELDPVLAHLWDEKTEQMKKRAPERYDEGCSGETMFQEAGIFAEFGRVVCISVGIIYEVGNELHLKEKSFYGEDEKKLLTEFADLLNRHYNVVNAYKDEENNYLCGHNSKEFDFPFIARRMLVHGIHLPEILNVGGKKPWECRFLDTMEMWKFGDYKHFTSLKLLCAIFGIPTPKDDIDGSQVAGVFYNEKDCDRIAKYCEKDVLATARVYLRMNGMESIKDENVEGTFKN
ncbi:MAG: 3'-5' exonuclease [Paludibacteraceae bacterium]|nr:3'-5' exonuclease [Paludibacteraceae bacterium]